MRSFRPIGGLVDGSRPRRNGRWGGDRGGRGRQRGKLPFDRCSSLMLFKQLPGKIGHFFDLQEPAWRAKAPIL